MSRFVRPGSVVLHISQGDTLTVRARLNAGEERAMFARMYAPPNGARPRIDPLQVAIARLTAYLLDWSFTDEQGQHVPIRDQPSAALEDTLNALDPDDFTEIREAIDDHIEQVEEARAAEKKRRDGRSTSSAPSTSRDAVAGATSGSTNSTPTSTP